MIDSNYSVLMSVYEKENPKYLRQCIDSVLNQTLPPNQIVIVKDGTLTSDLDELIDHYDKSNPKLFNIVSLDENVGLGLALNEGLKYCENELVARMDTDDIAVHNRFELQVKEFLNNKNLCILGTNIAEFDDNPNKIISYRIVPSNHNDILKFSKRRNPFNHPTVMYKKSEVLKVGGYSDYRRNQDLDLFVRMLISGSKSANLDKTLVLFRANKNNLKRRKSWEKCRLNIQIVYKFWRKKHSSITDLIIVIISQISIFLLPMNFFEWLSHKFLRSKKFR